MSRLSRAHGVLVVDKPGGMTSARVVSIVKRSLGVKKIGHTGTLDPMATGVLPLCIGEGTKIAGYLLAVDKVYEGELVLGVETDTLDREGKVVREARAEGEAVSETKLRAAMKTLTGRIEQVPPMFSALKQGGRRLHELARAGQEVRREPRSLVVHHFELLASSRGRARFSVEASKGTYVRSLVDDLGRALGCGAHLSELRRTRAGQFDLSHAISLEEISAGEIPVPLMDPAACLAHLPAARVPEALVASVADGKRLPWRELSDNPQPLGVFALQSADGRNLLAIAEMDQERIRYRRVFKYGLTQQR